MSKGISRAGLASKGMAQKGIAFKGVVGQNQNATPPSYAPLAIFGNDLVWAIDARMGVNAGTPVNNDPVSAWADQTSNHYDFGQLTTAAQPTYKTNILNGQPGISFDGVDDILVNLGTLTSQDFFGYMVFRFDNNTPNGRYVSADDNVNPDYATNGEFTIYNTGNTNNFSLYRNGNQTTILVMSGTSNFGFYGVQGTLLNSQVNGGAYSTAATTVSNFAVNHFSLGARRNIPLLTGTDSFMNMTVMAAGIVKVWPTTQQQTDLRNYIMSVWGI